MGGGEVYEDCCVFFYGSHECHISLIIAPSFADMGSFLLELEYPSDLKWNSYAFFMSFYLACMLAQGTVTSTRLAFYPLDS